MIARSLSHTNFKVVTPYIFEIATQQDTQTLTIEKRFKPFL